jgi:hypothetical protein
MMIDSLIITPVLNIIDNKTRKYYSTTLKDAIKNRISFLQRESLHSLAALRGDI